MSVHRCPKCSILYVYAEVEHGHCTTCGAPIDASPEAAPRAVPTPAPASDAAPHRAAPFVFGLLLGALMGAAALWMALRLGAPLLDTSEQTVASQDGPTQNTPTDNQKRESDTA